MKVSNPAACCFYCVTKASGFNPCGFLKADAGHSFQFVLVLDVLFQENSWSYDSPIIKIKVVQEASEPGDRC